MGQARLQAIEQARLQAIEQAGLQDITAKVSTGAVLLCYRVRRAQCPVYSPVPVPTAVPRTCHALVLATPLRAGATRY